MNIQEIGSTTRSLTAATVLSLVLGVAGCKSSTPAPPAIDDASLTAAVHGRLIGDAALSNERIDSSVQNGVVTLSGNVSNEAARSLAAADVSQIPGIKTVVNNL